MRFLTYIIISVILSFAVPYFLAKNKRFYFLAIGTIVLGGMLYFYPYIAVPNTLEDYQVSKINYQKVYFDESIECLMLVSESKKYRFSTSMIDYDSQNLNSEVSEIIEKVKTSSQAKIWFVESYRGFLLLKGIETENYYYNPSKSLIFENDTRWFTGGGIFFLVIGVVAFLMAVLTSYYGLDKYQSY